MVTSRGGEPLFKIELVGLEMNTVQRNGAYTINPDALIADIKKTDLIIIPAVHEDMQKGLELNKEFLPWITERYLQGSEVAAFCIGSFLLAETGLLNGKQCATHWLFANEFRVKYPDAKLVDDKIMTADDGLYTSGGAYSYLNLVIYLVEKFAGREIAIMTAKAFMIDLDRASQSPFIIFSGQKTHEDERIKEAQEFIEKNYSEKISVEQLTGMLALSRRNFERRFKKATSNTVTEYIRRVKMEAAKKNFETNNKNINEVMYEVGYSDNKAFRTVFKNVTGLSPVAYRKKYNKEEVVLVGR